MCNKVALVKMLNDSSVKRVLIFAKTLENFKIIRSRLFNKNCLGLDYTGGNRNSDVRRHDIADLAPIFDSMCICDAVYFQPEILEELKFKRLYAICEMLEMPIMQSF